MISFGVPALDTLIDLLAKLPGIGRKTAQRLAIFILKSDHAYTEQLSRAILALRKDTHECPECFNIAEGKVCEICGDEGRDRTIICVVELPKDVMGIEASGSYKGLYHVLGGHIAPLDGVGADDLNIGSLVSRVRGGGVKEIIIATNPTIEGDGTSLHISSILSPLKVRITRLARGLASGAAIEYSNKNTIAEAITGRGPLP